MNNISSNIKKVLFIFLVIFFVTISYITYFELIVSPKIVNNTDNKRLWAKRNEVLRGTIYDRNKKALTKSERVNTLTQKREYTGGAMFSHVLGYVNPQYGLTGLEAKYDQYLMGADDQPINQYLMELIKNKGKVSPEDKRGEDVVTTLDYNIQQQAYNLLGDNKGSVVVLNPKTGEILAMVSKPSYDPNDDALKASWAALNSNPDRPLLNRAVSGLYPPGSTFKTVTAISALENISGIQNETFNDPGQLVFNSTESLRDFGGESFGDIGFKHAYVVSSNVVFGKIGLQLGNNNLRQTAESFYFNKNIPCDGIVIDKSKFPTLKSYEKGNMAQSAIGQASVLATPIQMALVASTVANDGVMMKPHVVNEILSPNGDKIKSIEPESIGNIVSKENAATMKDFMRNVVEDGTGVNAAVEGIQVAGKTGTADHKVNGKDATPHSWFIGFAPYDNPQVAIAVIVEDGGQGGKAAAGIASKVIQTALQK
ncbi:cell division protein FtsI/penicillin-binding protein 2 [Clostridium acetobutylicum]|uniref:Penicillin-binding protein n=1 Tax=Clostridium acetobutylicum (strain ATCC 824 / DSM 792 / JCM 1419 / IAM 19013 / LMG 5710 / NBRC 13948 / NRRL B-527 / VKM B-1787 / 2291 / W) TaxID=272562 RepID=Q97LP8_CLOAB|nr:MULTISPECIES: penicillin-binding protein 2 [Clostridium]AAK78486.1 Penicillin-binding protein [Clostridium acetobutylicum ATCC 824]ADZ19556.1 Penicillin-binding protein [Clostridium acetobutylicum EA 2018]AEI31280.1 penicillin-binding protein [Clostridium acetobutylicum DSM 1731]AWV80207.1 penicillin-binding protein 2 [Clostridium acetobutylicum]MBC2392389.1 penicillin-binding protein 2 [Clostridium acetobutylicum]